MALPDLALAGVSNGGIPHQSRVWGFQLTLTANVPVSFDLRPLRNKQVIKDVQGVFIDNSANNAPASVAASGGQVIVVPPLSQGVFPLYLSDNDVLTFTGNGNVQYTLINFPTPVMLWSATPPLSASTTLTSRSKVSPNPAASTALMPANSVRKYLMIKAPETQDLWVNPLGGIASVGGVDCFKIAAGGTYESGTCAWNGAITFFTVALAANVNAAEG